jgi:hypothetical protein
MTFPKSKFNSKEEATIMKKEDESNSTKLLIKTLMARAVVLFKILVSDQGY